MTNAQTIIDQLLSGYVQQYEIPEEAQSVIERVRDRVVSSQDAMKDTALLYGTMDCDDMALGLMWVLERAAADQDRSVATPEEEQAVHTALTATLTRMGMLGEEPDSNAESVPEIGASDDPGMTVEPEPEPLMEEEPVADIEQAEPDSVDTAEAEDSGAVEPAADEDAGEAAQPTGEGSADPAVIGAQLEQLVEALQAGSDERDQLLSALRSSFALCLGDSSTDAVIRAYSESVDDFLGYVQENDLLDDVRVMNFFTNVQEPFAQWLDAAEDAREGVLEQAIDFLTDFRAMFE